MPIGTTFDQEVLAQQSEVEVKKESETATTSLFSPVTEIAQGRKGRFRLTAFVVSASAETVITLEDGTTTIGTFFLAAKTPLVVVLPGQGYVSTTPNNKLKFKSLNTAKFTSTYYGREE
jgi:hypothetical protein